MKAEQRRPAEAEAIIHRHWREELPYRALVHVKDSAHGTPLYMVAGSSEPARKASKALKLALELHGGRCFYCQAKGETVSAHFTLDHVEPKRRGGRDLLRNLVIACTHCNRSNAALPVEVFQPNAGREHAINARCPS